MLSGQSGHPGVLGRKYKELHLEEAIPLPSPPLLEALELASGGGVPLSVGRSLGPGRGLPWKGPLLFQLEQIFTLTYV